MGKQSWVAGIVIGLWVLALSYCGSAHADKLPDRARELVGQDRRGALRQLLAQNPELKALIEQIRKQVRSADGQKKSRTMAALAPWIGFLDAY